MNRSITLKDVAREAGLSIAAVSKALNGYPHVSEAARQRVAEASERLGYQPRWRTRAHAAAAAAAGRVRLGLILLECRPEDRDANRWAAAVARVAKAQGVRLELDQIPDQDADDCEAELHRHAKAVDGLLLLGYIEARVSRLIRQLPVPAMVVGDVDPTQPRPPYQLSIDHQGMASFATRTLLAAGHRRIGFVSPRGPGGGSFDQWRNGYQLAMLRSDAGLDRQLCKPFEGSQYEVGAAAARYMATLARPPSVHIVLGLTAAASFHHAMATRGAMLGPQHMVLGGDPGSAADHGLARYPLLSDNPDDGATQALQLMLRLHRGEPVPGRVLMPFRTHNFELLTDVHAAASPSR